ncbi:MAG: hypothetical protein IJU39_00440 [Clostridia bacterium]|nr:hypothetical protein [Clostridia bacterium]
MKTKVLSIILAVAVLFGVMQVSVFASDSNAITVYFSATSDEIIVPLKALTVKDGTAEEYGFTVNTVDHNNKAVNGVSVFDVIVTAHIVYYGEKFTKETASEYLAISGGYLQKAFGKPATASGFAVNGKVPHDDIMTSYGYTGYAADTAVVAAGDLVSFYFYQDTKGYTDVLASLGTNEITLKPGESYTYTLSGYYAAWYGCYDDATIASKTEALNDVDVFMKEANDKTFTKVGTTDDNGQLKVTFEKEGEYTLYATGETDAECPIVYTWSVAHVTNEVPANPEPQNNPSIMEKVVKALENVLQFVYNVIVRVERFFSGIFNIFK